MTVHPRLRGELDMMTSVCNFVNGSSPLARGTRTRKQTQIHPRRFIPACAGNSRAFLLPISRISVHPRFRGELCHRVDNHINSFGSSPLARRTLPMAVLFVLTCRFIPACAANSVLLQMPDRNQTVHPRLRGELVSLRFGIGSYVGSSPLARRTHLKWL